MSHLDAVKATVIEIPDKSPEPSPPKAQNTRAPATQPKAETTTAAIEPPAKRPLPHQEPQRQAGAAAVAAAAAAKEQADASAAQPVTLPRQQKTATQSQPVPFTTPTCTASAATVVTTNITSRTGAPITQSTMSMATTFVTDRKNITGMTSLTGPVSNCEWHDCIVFVCCVAVTVDLLSSLVTFRYFTSAAHVS